MALRAKNTRGMTVPWLYVRRQLARAWGVPPWVVDEAPIDEIELELDIARIEFECCPKV